MDASAWIALAGLAFVVLAQLVAIAFLLGGLFNRMKNVEGKPSDTDCKTELAVLAAKFEAMKETLENVASDLKNLASNAPHTPLRSAPGRRASAQ